MVDQPIESTDEDINSKDIEDQTALFYAIRYGRETVVRLLMKRDELDVNFANKERQ